MALAEETGEEATVKCGAGVSLAELVNFSIEKGLSGLEWATGIPGTVGGAVRGNAGAYGTETKDSIVLVKGVKVIFDESKKVESFEPFEFFK